MAKDWIHGEKSITWQWILRDFAFRIILYLTIPLLALRFLSLSPESIGITLPNTKQLLLTIPLSIFTFGLCLYFRGGSRRKRHLNPTRDFWFSFYLFFINSPTEELFYRGFLLLVFTKLLGNPAYALVVSSLLFGWQHFFFFGASSKSVIFDTMGGFFLGFCYSWLGKSLVPVIIIHGVSNLALFTLGTYIIRKWRLWES
jgi:membrane protease YdiL (CAAX protease family)